MNVIITCGGTGGHIYPAIALYGELMKNKPDADVLFIGSDYGLEKDIFKSEGIPFVLIKSRGIRRSLSISNIYSLFCNLIAFFQAKKILTRFKPDLVISTGAYPTFHITYYSVKRKIPVYLIEGNILPGFVTRLFAGKAQKIFTASEMMLKYLNARAHSRVVVTGTPSRIIHSEKTSGQIFLEQGLSSEKKVVTIIGGSCGAEKINECIVDLVNSREVNYQIIWATGKKHYSRIVQSIKNKPSNVKFTGYIDNMNEILEITNLIVCRSGAMTIQELKDFFIPAILVPFARAAGNHQYINALELKDAGAAEIIPEEELDSSKLHLKISQLIEGKEMLESMKAGYGTLEKVNACEKIYNIISSEMEIKNAECWNTGGNRILGAGTDKTS